MQCNLPIFSTKIAYTCQPFGEQGCGDCPMAAVINVLKFAVIIAWLTVVSDMYFATGPYIIEPQVTTICKAIVNPHPWHDRLDTSLYYISSFTQVG
jgi:hypothetical protein